MKLLTTKKLSCWNTFQKALVSGKTAKTVGFLCKDGDLSRFEARWRLAANLSGVVLDGYSAKTQRGYAGILKLVLAINAAEEYALAAGLVKGTQNKIQWDKLSARIGECKAKPKASVAAKALFETLNKHLAGTALKSKISKMEADGLHDSLVIGQGVRHLFVHGILTAGANEASPESIGIWCEQMANAVLAALDQDFSRSISPYR